MSEGLFFNHFFGSKKTINQMRFKWSFSDIVKNPLKTPKRRNFGGRHCPTHPRGTTDNGGIKNLIYPRLIHMKKLNPWFLTYIFQTLHKFIIHNTF